MTSLIASMHQKLEQDFPNFAEEARLLMRASLYFSKLVDDYHTACQVVERLLEGTSGTHESELHQVRKQRLKLKDEIMHGGSARRATTKRQCCEVYAAGTPASPCGILDRLRPTGRPVSVICVYFVRAGE